MIFKLDSLKKGYWAVWVINRADKEDTLQTRNPEDDPPLAVP